MKYTSDIKEIKEFGLARSVLYNFVLSVFITLVLAVIAIYALGLRLDIVLSDSMYPVFREHDIVIVMPFDDYNVDDIIEFQYSKVTEPVSHRIIEKIGSGKTAKFITKGDAVGIEDAATIEYSQINGKVISIIENGENIYNFMKSNYFLLIDIILGIWVLTSTLSNEREMRKHNIAQAQ